MSRANAPNATDRKLFLKLLSRGGSSITESPDGTISTNVWQHAAYSVSSTGGVTLYLNDIVDGLRIGEKVLAVRYKKVGENPRAYVELTQLFAQPQ